MSERTDMAAHPVTATVLERSRVREAAGGLGEPTCWMAALDDGWRFGEGAGSLPDDLGAEGRAFGPTGEVRWEGETALRLALAEPNAGPRPARGEGLEELDEARVLACASGPDAPGLSACPWRAVRARRVLSDGSDAYLRFCGVEGGPA